MEIDWSLAPEGATHFHPQINGYVDHWVKLDGNDSYFCVTGFEGEGWKRDICKGNHSDLIARPPLTVADLKLESPTLHLQWFGRIERKWTGSSLPPINTECEAKNPITENWYMVKILDHDKSGECAVCREISTDKLWWSDSFRPVKTAEEIAAEEREKAVSEMYSVFYSQPDTGKEAMYRLYDSGFKKVQP